MAVQLNDSLGTLGTDNLQVGSDVLVGRVGHHAGQDVALEEIVVRILRLQNHLLAGQFLASLHVVVHLVVQAALQLGAHAGQLLRVERDILEAGGVGRHRNEVLHPRGAAQLAATGASAADASGLLTRANLLHLDAHVEGSCQVLDELAEVHALVGDVIEDGLLAVALILHVANLHVQTEALGNLAALDHCLVLAGLGLAELVHVNLAGNAVDAPDVVGRLQVSLFQLQLHQTACQRHHADVVAGVCLDGHDVALLQRQVVHVVVIALAGVLELHLHEVGRFLVARHVGQPVVGVELAVLSAYCLVAESAVAAGPYFIFFFHILSLFRCFDVSIFR